MTRRPAARTGNGKEAPRSLQVSALKLVQKITALRPELDLYILIAKEHEDQVVDALFAEAVDGYFYREERDLRGCTGSSTRRSPNGPARLFTTRCKTTF